MKKHIFHLVMHRSIKNMIIRLSKKLKLSQSATVMYIIKNSLSIMEKYQFTSDEHDSISKYRLAVWKTHLHLYLDEELFRKIRHLCDSMFAFSMAIVIRKLIMLYFIKKNKYKTEKIDYLNVLKRYERIFVKKFKLLRNWIKPTIQLNYPYYCQLTYNKRFALIGFNLLN